MNLVCFVFRVQELAEILQQENEQLKRQLEREETEVGHMQEELASEDRLVAELRAELDRVELGVALCPVCLQEVPAYRSESHVSACMAELSAFVAEQNKEN